MKIPFSFIPERKLVGLSRLTLGMGEKIKPFFPYLNLNLKQCESNYEARHYIAMCFIATFIFFIISFITAMSFAFLFRLSSFLLMPFLISSFIAFFVFLQQMFYPRLVASRRIVDIDKNLLPALRNLLIHLNSGVSLFEAVVAISNQNYGGVSKEFKKMVKEISSGLPAVDAIEISATNSPSLYYRRALWQMSNGMKSGSNISIVMNDIIDNLSKEQIIQIEQYGSQLNPLAMFYMIIAVIVPSLGVTLLMILSSFVSLGELTTKLVFYGILVFVLLFQILFLGMIKTRRPNLLGF